MSHLWLCHTTRLQHQVSQILVHWMGIPSWLKIYPEATVYVPPPAAKIAPAATSGAATDSFDVIPSDLPTDVRDKLAPYVASNTKMVVLEPSGQQVCADLSQQLMEGAPDATFNEVVFCHKPSKTLIVGDGFYGGYGASDVRVWVGGGVDDDFSASKCV